MPVRHVRGCFDHRPAAAFPGFWRGSATRSIGAGGVCKVSCRWPSASLRHVEKLDRGLRRPAVLALLTTTPSNRRQGAGAGCPSWLLGSASVPLEGRRCGPISIVHLGTHHLVPHDRGFIMVSPSSGCRSATCGCCWRWGSVNHPGLADAGGGGDLARLSVDGFVVAVGRFMPALASGVIVPDGNRWKPDRDAPEPGLSDTSDAV